MFKAIEVLQPNFIQRPLNELWQLISLFTIWTKRSG